MEHSTDSGILEPELRLGEVLFEAAPRARTANRTTRST